MGGTVDMVELLVLQSVIVVVEEEVEVGFVVLMGEDLGSSEIMDVEIVRP